MGRANHLLKDPSLQAISERLGKSLPQVILRWHYQLGTIPPPKASSVERQRENLSLFDFALCENDLAIIFRLSTPAGRLNNQDPAVYEEF